MELKEEMYVRTNAGIGTIHRLVENKVYVVFEDNGESYEDYDYWITKIFSSEERAKKYIKNSKAEEQRLCEKLPYRDKHDFWLKEYEIEEINSNE